MAPTESSAKSKGPRSPSKPVNDLVGIGFGVTGLALAVALFESGRAESAQFFERQNAFSWHSGMLIDGASMQVSFLKDIVTMRNPTSDFSFVSYLHKRGRLASFVNHDILMPSRREFHDYLSWVADRLDGLVQYGVEITGVRPVLNDRTVTALDLVAGDRVVARTRNLVIGTGLRPRLPVGVEPNERIWHSSELLHRMPNFDNQPPRRVMIIGAGQSAAEVALHVMDRYPLAEVCPVYARYGYSTADSNPFANQIFDPEAVDNFYFAPADVKQSLLSYHSNTNYSAVDSSLLRELYRRQYEQSVTGTSRLRILHASRLCRLNTTEGALLADVEFLPTGGHTVLNVDLMIYATGYDSGDPTPLLAGVSEYLCPDDIGNPRISRDYRLHTLDEMRCGIYIQGATEGTHGIASTLLSVAAIRADEILQSVVRQL